MSESTSKRMIVAYEKHERRYLDASTDEAWAASSLKLLSERFNDGYCYHSPDELYDAEGEYSDLAAAELTDEQIAELPGHSVRRAAELARKQAQAEFAEKQKYERWYRAMQEVVENADLSFVGKGRQQRPRAWGLLQMRSDAEYESVSLETLETAAA